MKADEYIKKDVIYAKIFIIIGVFGLAIWLISVVFGFKDGPIVGVASGLSFGFIPTGIGMLIIYKIAGKNSAMMKNIELENEERNKFINTKSGHTAFWVSYWYIFTSVMISNIIIIPFNKFGVFTLVFMPIVYFLVVVINHKRY